jgi:hypothetical protein
VNGAGPPAGARPARPRRRPAPGVPTGAGEAPAGAAHGSGQRVDVTVRTAEKSPHFPSGSFARSLT